MIAQKRWIGHRGLLFCGRVARTALQVARKDSGGLRLVAAQFVAQISSFIVRASVWVLPRSSRGRPAFAGKDVLEMR